MTVFSGRLARCPVCFMSIDTTQWEAHLDAHEKHIERLEQHMSKDYTCAEGVYHIKIKLFGDQGRAELFHEIMAFADIAWPWKTTPFGNSTQCTRCDGLVITRPRVNASDIKAAARQAQVKVKIVRFTPEEKCYVQEHQYSSTAWIQRDKTHQLYRSDEWLRKHRGEPVPRLVPQVFNPKVIELPEATVTQDGDPKPVVINISGVERTSSSCLCWCHKGAETWGKRDHRGGTCCPDAYKLRVYPVRPPIVEATMVDPTAERVPHQTTERQLMAQILGEAEAEAAGAPPAKDEDEPWGGFYPCQ